MKGWLLTLSIFLSVALVTAIQNYNITLGYLIGAVLIALHFFAIALTFTKRPR